MEEFIKKLTLTRFLQKSPGENINAQQIFKFVESCLVNLKTNILDDRSSDIITKRKTALKKYVVLNNFIKNNHFRSKILSLNNSIVEYFAKVKYSVGDKIYANNLEGIIEKIDFSKFNDIGSDKKTSIDNITQENFYSESSKICGAGDYTEFNKLEGKVIGANIKPISPDNFDYKLISGGVLAGTMFYNYLGSFVLVILIILIIYLLYKLLIEKPSTTEDPKKISGFQDLPPNYININPSTEFLDRVPFPTPYRPPTINNIVNKPIIPSRPTIPLKPVLPVLPTKPVLPVIPTKPVLPIKPVLPVIPVKPVLPVNPVLQTKPYIF
jgi:hypothetical protein